MAKLRKMLGNADSTESISLMRLIETQSKHTLADWAVNYAKENYLHIFEKECPGDMGMLEMLTGCEAYLTGSKKLDDIKPLLNAGTKSARDLSENPVAQAAARAITTACSTVRTPTNALGFLYYGAAATAYHTTGMLEDADTYDRLARKEFQKAISSLQKAAVADEAHPVKIKWNC